MDRLAAPSECPAQLLGLAPVTRLVPLAQVGVNVLERADEPAPFHFIAQAKKLHRVARQLPVLTEPFRELDGIGAEVGWTCLHLASTHYQIKFCHHSASMLTAINATTIVTDPQYQVKPLGISLFFPEVWAHIF